ncbi:MAG: alpha/beta hydrolase [Pseudomonadota bacterium]
MMLDVDGQPTYCYTGGKNLDTSKPTAVFIHGVLDDHSVWILQSRYLANHGWNVLAIDLPGHGKSRGEAPQSVEAAAGFVGRLIDSAGISRAALVGHSWGSLIALEAAAALKERISHLVLIGTAHPMKVSPMLLDASVNDPLKALALINVYSRSTLAPPPSAMGPGTWVFGSGMALGKRVLQSNREVNVFHRGFLACDRYANGERAIANISCPVLFLLGKLDQMTPPKAAQGLIAAAREAGNTAKVVTLDVGHRQMLEAPEETLHALVSFLNAPLTST